MTAFAANDIYSLLRLIGDYEKSPNDFNLAEVKAFVEQALSPEILDERSLRRMIRGLGITKNIGGYYTHADIAVIVGWIKRSKDHRYSSYREFMEVEGKGIYSRAKEIFNGN